MKYFSTFSGIGGFELGIGDKAECIGYSEIDRYATQIYDQHFHHKNYGDITKLSTDAIPDFDLLCGGFPCQSFSIAGKRGGFNDTRGTLFFDLARIARAKRPRLLFFENVKGLLSHNGGATFDTIIRTVDELGYDCQWQVLNSKNFGVPQNRERVFIIGHLRGTSRPQVFPLLANGQRPIETERQVSRGVSVDSARGDNPNSPGWLLQNGESGHLSVGTLRTHNDGKGFREVKSGVALTIPARAREDGSGQPVVMVALTEKRTEEAKQIRKESLKQGKDFSPRRSKQLESRTDGQIGTITSSRNQDNQLTDGMRIRRLTPVECERLQGFPDGWTEGISDTQRYKTLGNAVTVNVIQYIAERLI